MAVVLETTGNYAGFSRLPARSQWLIGLAAMLGYGLISLAIARVEPNFLQAFPLGYAFAYFITGLVLAVVMGSSFSRWEKWGAVLVISGFLISLFGDRLAALR